MTSTHRYVFDIEGDNLLDKITKLHCLVIHDLGSKLTHRFNSQGLAGVRLGHIESGLRMLADADEIIGHNILSFDIPAIQKLYPWFKPGAKVTDTLVCSRVIWPDRFDLISRDQMRGVPPELRGNHSLKAWGYRLRLLKGDFGQHHADEAAWAAWSQEMEDYCVQDVAVTTKLWEVIEAKQWAPESLELEHRFRALMDKQERHGFRLDVPAVQRLYAALAKQRLVLETQLHAVFPPRIETMKTPSFWSEDPSDLGAPRYPTKGAALAAGAKAKLLLPGPPKTKEHPFKPGSGADILARLVERYAWQPVVYGFKKKVVECKTDKDRAAALVEGYSPKITEDVLRALPYPEAPLLADYMVLTKRIGQVAEGDEAWLKLERAGRLHGRVNTAGAVTGRCTHSNPNLAQVPAVHKKKIDGKPTVLLGLAGGFGWECRSVFLPDAGHALVGWDASGLELRCLAHFMGRYDDGAYARVLLEGDIHAENQKAAGLPTRDNAKTFIYAFLYGAGDAKIGSIVGGGAAQGKALKAKFLKGLPALARLKQAIAETVAERGHLRGLDGRILPVRSAHAALNTLLQSAGAIAMKQALVFQYEALVSQGYAFGPDFAFVANIHDEVQTSCRPEIADAVGQAGVAAIKKAGEHFGFRCPLDGEFKVGSSWAETH
jgi:DNA polymerase I